MEDKENPLERDHCLSVVLPGGLEKTATVHGSKPVMDLLVTLCATYHLNPSDYTVEILSANKNNISFKPNSPIGSLEADKILLKPKGMEEKIRRPYVPEATVRLLINYRKSHKAVVRVNPRVPLELLMPAICSKCEFDMATTILLRDSQSHEPLELTKSLNDHGLREVFAKDTAAVTPAEVILPPPPEVCVEDPNPPKKEKEKKEEKKKEEKKEKENKGFFSLFRKGKKKPETNASTSAPATPGLIQRVLSLNSLAVHSSNTLPADTAKKRRAPPPPLGASQSVPNNLSTHHLGGSQGSADSTLKRTKRRAPPPPCGNPQPEDTEVKGTINSLYTLQEQRENEELLFPSSSVSSPSPPQLASSSSSSSLSSSVVHLQEVNDQCLPTAPSLGKELPDDAACALARILTSSLYDGTLGARLNNSATFPRMHSCSSSSLPLAQRWPHSGSFRSELGSKLKLRPSADLEWQDPIERKEPATFKVVPQRKQRWYEVEVTLEAPDQNQHTSEDNQPTSEAAAEALDHQTEAQENLGKSLESPERERPLLNSEPCPLEMLVSGRPSSPPPLACPKDEPSQTSPITEVEEDERCETSPIPEVEEDLQKSNGDCLVSAKSESPPASLLDHSNGALAADANSDPEQESASFQSPSKEPLNTEMDQISSDVHDGDKVDDISSDVHDGDKVDDISSDVHERDKVDEISSDVHERDKVDDISSDVHERDKVDEISSDVHERDKVDEISSDVHERDKVDEISSDVHERDKVDEISSDVHERDKVDDISPDVHESTKVDEISSEVHDGDKVDDISSDVHERDKVDDISSEVHERDKVDDISSEVHERDKVNEISSEVHESSKVNDIQEEEDYFPPPPPPVSYDDEEKEEEEEREEPPATPSTQPSSPTCIGQTNGFNGDHLVQLTSPKPYRSPTAHRLLKRVGTASSGFAQAVALAVQRSQSQSKRRGSQVTCGPPCSTATPPGLCTDTVPEWLPHTSVNGSSCLG